MSEEFDKEQFNDIDINSSSSQDDNDVHFQYENGMRVLDNPYQNDKDEDEPAHEQAAAPIKRKKHTLDKAILIIAVIVFIISSAVIVKTVVDIKINKTQANELANLVGKDEQQTSEYGEDGILEKYRNAYNANNDLVGWIVVPNTTINHPVVQAGNNSYYMRRSFYGAYQRRGTIFMDYRNHADNLCKNTIIYGHNFLDSTMFADLEKYKDIEFYRTSPVIEFDTIYQKYKWKIISVFMTSADSKDDNGYIFNYIYPFMTDDNFEDYIDELFVRSLYFTGVDVNKNDKILTLSTCTRDLDVKGNGETNARFVVVARLVREGESEEVNTAQAVENSKPRYPQIWYDIHEENNPYIYANKWFPEGVAY